MALRAAAQAGRGLGALAWPVRAWGLEPGSSSSPPSVLWPISPLPPAPLRSPPPAPPPAAPRSGNSAAWGLCTCCPLCREGPGADIHPHSSSERTPESLSPKQQCLVGSGLRPPGPGGLFSSTSFSHLCMLSCFSCVGLFVTPWTVARQAPLSKEFSRPEYWSGLPFHSAEDRPDPGIELASLMSSVLASGFSTASAPGKPVPVSWCYSLPQLRPTLCDPTGCRAPGLSVLHCLLKFAQVHVHCISDTIQPSHLLTPSSPSALSLSQCQGLFR